MIQIDHCKKTDMKYTSTGTTTSYEVNMDMDLIKHDIERMRREYGRTKNKFDNRNIEAIIKLLEKTLKILKKTDGTLQFSWTKDPKSDIPVTYPIPFIDEPLYKINMCNYIKLNDNQKVVYIPMMDLAEIISYEYVHKDLDISVQEVDKMLSECSFLGNNDASVLLSKIHVSDDNVYNLAIGMKVDDTGFGSADENVIYDYFYSKEFDFVKGEARYKDVINYSCKYANNIIANSLCKKIETTKLKANAVAINATSLALIVTDVFNTGIEINDDCLDEVVVSAFGRKFKISLKSTIL